MPEKGSVRACCVWVKHRKGKFEHDVNNVECRLSAEAGFDS